ncbi:MAG: heparinase II/III family protein [bacterium]
MLWLRRAPGAALAVALASIAVGLSACDDEDSETVALPPPPECAPPLYDSIRKQEAYPDSALAAATEEQTFNLRGFKLRLAPAIDWGQNPDDSTAFQGKLQGFTWLDLLIYAYRTGDTKALAQARDISLDWIRANPFANPYLEGRDRGDSKPWIDKVTAARVQFIAYVAAAADCEGMLSARQRRTLESSLQQHGAFLADPAAYHETNHGLYADRGLYVLSRLYPDLPAAKAWRRLAIDRFTRTLRLHLTGGEGFWLEHSAGYQLAINRLVDGFLDLISNEDRRLTRIARQMNEVTGWVIEPDGEIALSGDSNLKAVTPEELASSQAGQGLRWLPKTGLAFVRRQDPAAYLQMMASFHSTTHHHADDLSFDLFDRGHRIVSDTGLYHKDLDRFQAFQESPQAHSVLWAAPGGIARGDSAAYGSGLDAAGRGDGWYAVLGHDPLQQQIGVAHSRLFLYRPGYALAVVDWARSDYPRQYRRYFQIDPGVEVEREGGSLRLLADGLDATLTSSANTKEHLRLARAEKHPLAGFAFLGFRQAVPRWTVTFQNETDDLDAVATFGLDPAQQVTARLVGEPTSEGLALRILSEGADLGTILVIRKGDRLRVLASPELEGEEIPEEPVPLDQP